MPTSRASALEALGAAIWDSSADRADPEAISLESRDPVQAPVLADEADQVELAAPQVAVADAAQVEDLRQGEAVAASRAVAVAVDAAEVAHAAVRADAGVVAGSRTRL